MDFYKLLKNLPGVYQFRRIRYLREFRHAQWTNLFDGIYPDFAAALKHVPPTKPIGYDHAEPAKMYKERTSRVYPTDYPILFWLYQVMIPGMKVFDLGGHIGVSYYAYQKYLEALGQVTWQVCDVAAVVEAGKKLAHENAEPALSFTTDINEANGSDILLASGSLQYLEYNISDFLSNLVSKPSHLLINLLPLHPSKEFVTIQNIGTAFCPYRVFQQDKFISSLTAINYNLVDRWDNAEKKCNLPFQESFSVKPYQGLYFCLQT